MLLAVAVVAALLFLFPHEGKGVGRNNLLLVGVYNLRCWGYHTLSYPGVLEVLIFLTDPVFDLYVGVLINGAGHATVLQVLPLLGGMLDHNYLSYTFLAARVA